MARDLKTDPAGFITDLYLGRKQWRQSQEDRWKKYYKMYRSYRDATAYPFKSNIYVPYTFSIIESVVPKMLGTIFNTRPIITVEARKGASEPMARVMERMLEYRLDDENLEFFNKILEFFKECAIYGTSFMKILPRFNDDEMASSTI